MSAAPERTVFSAEELIGGSSRLLELTPPARLCVLGNPVAHSRSPEFHNAALRACGIDAQYIRVETPEDRLADCLRALPARGFVGANVTIPHKASALQLVDEVDPHAMRAGGVNTILCEGSRLRGFSTDGPGLVRALQSEFYVDLRNLRVMILGAAGGAGRAIAAQCAEERCDRLVLVNRTPGKLLALIEELQPLFTDERLRGPSDRLCAIAWEDGPLREALGTVDIIINASSVGMKRTDPAAIPASLLDASMLVYDTVYASGKSALIEAAESVGARAASGLSMLLHQGALSFEIWFGREAPIDVMRAALGD